MKIRLGFVSNSSSSAYVVLLPDKFNLDGIDLSRYTKEMIDDGFVEDEINTEEKPDPEKHLKDLFKKLKRDKSMWYDEDTYAYILADLLSRQGFVISEIDMGSSDGGQIILVNKKKVRKILQ